MKDRLEPEVLKLPDVSHMYGPVATCDGYVKVKLFFWTSDPQHIRSVLLAASGAKAPFIEDICVLIPQCNLYPHVEAFGYALDYLKYGKIVGSSANLHSFKIVESDTRTLAYVIP